jgi:integrative and conjugative element protein (TIGR02256 family)
VRTAPVGLHIDAAATEFIHAAAERSHPTETGGLLLGWWDSGGIIVHLAAEVPDETATPTSWHRQQRPAQHVLEQALSDREHPWLGYVGDWHTHPAAIGPSCTDVTSLRRASLQYDQPLLLLVRRHDHRIAPIVMHRGRRRHSTTLDWRERL